MGLYGCVFVAFIVDVITALSYLEWCEIIQGKTRAPRYKHKALAITRDVHRRLSVMCSGITSHRRSRACRRQPVECFELSPCRRNSIRGGTGIMAVVRPGNLRGVGESVKGQSS